MNIPSDLVSYFQFFSSLSQRHFTCFVNTLEHPLSHCRFFYSVQVSVFQSCFRRSWYPTTTVEASATRARATCRVPLPIDTCEDWLAATANTRIDVCPRDPVRLDKYASCVHTASALIPIAHGTTRLYFVLDQFAHATRHSGLVVPRDQLLRAKLLQSCPSSIFFFFFI